MSTPKRNRGLYSHLRQEEAGSVVDQAVGGLNLRHERFGESSTTASGFVITHVAGTYTYLVELNGRRMWATDIPSTLNVLGARTYSTYAPGTWVILWMWSSFDSIAYIIGSAPEKNDQDFDMMGHLRVQGSPAGYHKEPVHTEIPTYLAEQEANHAMYNAAFASGRPLDVLTGDWGVINEFDVGIDVRKLVAGMYGGMASVVTSVVDDTLRLTGGTIIEESLTTRRRQFNDQGEGSEIFEMTPRLCEGLGALSMGKPSSNTNTEVLLESKRARTEPRAWDQEALFRYVRMSGWLGDLVHTYITNPTADKLDDEIMTRSWRRNKGMNWPGLADFYVGQDGFVAVRTAKGILLQKTNMIPVPEELREPGEPEGDKDSEVCKTSSQNTDYKWGTDDPMARPQLMADHNAFRNTLGNNANVLEHQKDWRVPDASEVAIGSSDAEYKALTTAFRKDLPTTADLELPRRTVKYYKSTSSILMTDDGGIIFEDGYGAIVSMTGGNIEISPPGDIIMRPGRRFVVMAPHDTIIRSGRNVDVSAALGDVRVKAEKNLHMLAGNSEDGKGGILLESRSKGGENNFAQGQEAETYGIMFKSSKSPICAWGSDVYMRALSADSLGSIILDAKAGTGPIRMYGATIDSYAASRVSATVGLMPGSTAKPETASYWSQSASSVSGQVGSTDIKIDGGSLSLIGKDENSAVSLFLDGPVTARSYLGLSKEIGVTTDSNIKTQASTARRSFKPAIDEIGKDLSVFMKLVYENNGWGVKKTYENVAFSFNTSASFGTADSTFKLFELPWQARNKAAGATAAWSEPEVTFGNGAKSLPWPGKEAWEGSNYGITNESLNNLEKNTGHMSKSPWKTKPNYASSAGGGELRTEIDGKAATFGAFKDKYTVSLQGDAK